MNFENPRKLENFEKNCWRYHYFRLFFAFYPSPTKPDPENQNIEKMKKNTKPSGGVIILNLCNKKHNHMMNAYSDMECDSHNFCHFRQLFAFTSLFTPEIKIWKKM